MGRHVCRAVVILSLAMGGGCVTSEVPSTAGPSAQCQSWLDCTAGPAGTAASCIDQRCVYEDEPDKPTPDPDEEVRCETERDCPADHLCNVQGRCIVYPCTRLLPLRLFSAEPSAMVLLFTAEDCASGGAKAGLSEANFLVQENGRPLSSEAARRILPSQGLRAYITLLLDLSDSTRPNLDELVAASQRFVDTMLTDQAATPIRISIEVFDGSPDTQTLLAPTRDVQKLKDTLAGLTTYTARDGGSTNLHGALRQGIQRLQGVQRQVMQESYDGVVTTGYLVVFTDGDDTSGRVTASDAKNAVELGQRYDPEQGVLETVQTFAVGLKSADYDPAALREVVGQQRRVFEADDASGLDQAFERLAQEVQARLSGTYLLAYCSPARAGRQEVTIETQNTTTGLELASGIIFTFNADGFRGGCNADFFESACDNRQCGGFNCGACEEGERCDSQESGQCISR